jgi:hypothetical protein
MFTTLPTKLGASLALLLFTLTVFGQKLTFYVVDNHDKTITIPCAVIVKMPLSAAKVKAVSSAKKVAKRSVTPRLISRDITTYQTVDGSIVIPDVAAIATCSLYVNIDGYIPQMVAVSVLTDYCSIKLPKFNETGGNSNDFKEGKDEGLRESKIKYEPIIAAKERENSELKADNKHLQDTIAVQKVMIIERDVVIERSSEFMLKQAEALTQSIQTMKQMKEELEQSKIEKPKEVKGKTKKQTAVASTKVPASEEPRTANPNYTEPVPVAEEPQKNKNKKGK